MNPSSSFPKLKLKQFPLLQDRETSEAKYWKNYCIVHEEKLLGSPNCVHFDPSGSGSFIITASTRVNLYDPVTHQLQRAYSRFEDDAFAGKFRRDGKLIVAGDKTGYVKVFDVISKAVLRQLKKHSAAVRSTVWCSDALHFLSGSDDRSAIVWDLAMATDVWSTRNASTSHSDYIRSVDASPIDNHILVTGSYDHTVGFWDTRQQDVVRRINASAPVSSCMFSSSGTLLFTAAGNEIKIWDVVSGGKLLHTFANHQKDITSLCVDPQSSKLFSTGLDGHLKIYNTQSLQVLHGLKFGSPLLSCGISTNGMKIVVGYVDGRVEVRSRPVATSINADVDVEEERALSSMPDTRKRKYYKGAGISVTDAMSLANGEDSADPQEVVVDSERVTKLRPYEQHLKKFNYQLALDAALKTRNPVVVITVIEELCRRSGLIESLSGRDEVTLEPLLSFLSKYIVSPKYTRLLITVGHTVLDLYATALGHSDSIDELVLKLQRQIQQELQLQRQIMRVSGSLDGVVQMAMRCDDR